MNPVDSDDGHPAVVALRASVAIPPRQGQRMIDAVVERVRALDGMGGVSAHTPAHGGVVVFAGALRIEVWRSGHWQAAARGRTISTAETISHGGQWLSWVADRIDVEAKNGRLRNSPFR